MVKLLLRYARFIRIPLAFAVTLLAVQAWGDLSLPAYMSNIVNVGIQQGGISDVVPVKASGQTMNALLSVMSEQDRAAAMSAYDVDPSNVWSLNPKADKSAIEPAFTAAFRALIPVMAAGQGRSVALDGMPDSAVTQAAVSFLRPMYESLGVDTDKLQSDYIMMEGLKMLGLSLLVTVAAVITAMLGSRVAATVAKFGRRDVFNKVVSFSNAEFEKISTASLITRSTNDVQQIQGLIPMLVRTLIYAPIMGIGGILKILRTEASMTWILALAVAVLITVFSVTIYFAMPRFNIMQKIVDKVNLIMREALSGMLVIRAFNTQRHEEKRFDEANKELMGIHLFVGRLMSSMMPIMTIIMNGTQLLILWVGANKIAAADIQIGDMFAFIQYSMQVIMSFLFISMMSFMLPRAQVAAKRVNEVLDTNNTVLDPETPAQIAKGGGEVVFKNVSFRYPDAEDDVLRDINFTAKAGKVTAFIGSTGSGKSTLINLIPRFYDITGGQLLVDGKDVRSVPQSALRDKIGYIPQKGVLFTGTIETNLKLAGGIDDARMKWAARIAQADGFIDEKEGKYGEPISQGGTNVSGGQRQRLSIARALAKKPDIYIFDDSFSALDFKTDAALRAAIGKELSAATILIVAQRIGTIKNADQIVVLDEGAVVGIGTHKSLLNDCEVYKQIALSQLSQAELDKDLERGATA